MQAGSLGATRIGQPNYLWGPRGIAQGSGNFEGAISTSRIDSTADVPQRVELTQLRHQTQAVMLVPRATTAAKRMIATST